MSLVILEKFAQSGSGFALQFDSRKLSMIRTSPLYFLNIFWDLKASMEYYENKKILHTNPNSSLNFNLNSNPIPNSNSSPNTNHNPITKL